MGGVFDCIMLQMYEIPLTFEPFCTYFFAL